MFLLFRLGLFDTMAIYEFPASLPAPVRVAVEPSLNPQSPSQPASCHTTHMIPTSLPDFGNPCSSLERKNYCGHERHYAHCVPKKKSVDCKLLKLTLSVRYHQHNRGAQERHTTPVTKEGTDRPRTSGKASTKTPGSVSESMVRKTVPALLTFCFARKLARRINRD